MAIKLARINSNFNFKLDNPITILIGGGILLIILGGILSIEIFIGIGLLLSCIGGLIYLEKRRK